jgi:hypothetical protein
MPEAEFEPTVTVSERAKTVYALDRSATLTGVLLYYLELNFNLVLALV